MADMKMVDGEIVPLTKAEQVDHDARIAAWQADAGNRAIKAQIAALENAGLFTRKQRELILNTAELQAIDSQIAILRSQLT